MLKLLFILVFVTVSISYSEDIQTDRPDQTESTYIVPNNSLQIELGLENDNFDKQKILYLPTALFRYGISKYVELRLAEQFTG